MKTTKGWACALMIAAAGGIAGAPAAEAAPTRIDVPAGRLADALNSLAAQTGLQIGYDSGLTAGRSTQGLSGTYEPEAALDLLIAGAGLTARPAGGGAVTLVAAPAAAEAGPIQLAPITITGEKFAREPSRTFTSVGVVTDDQIVDLNLDSLDRAIDRMPNVTSQSSATGDARITIRGLNAEGVTQPTRSAPIVAVIVDGAQQGIETTRRGSRGLWDVEQVEVLRGPQSTIQGRNALGGAVIVETHDPVYEREAIFQGDAGTGEAFGGAFVVNTPIVEGESAMRLTGQISRLEKDIDYPNPAFRELGDEEFEEFRGKFLIEPDAVPDLSALFTVSYTHDKPGWNAVTGPDFFAREFDDPTLTTAEFRDTEVMRYVAELNYDFGDGLRLTSVSAFSDTNVSIQSPAGGAFDRDDTRDAKDFSQDLRLSFDADGIGLSGVVGFFAGHFETDLSSNISTNLLAPFIPTAIVQQLEGVNETTNFAAYADLRYELTDNLTLLAGGRILRERVAAEFDGIALDIGATQTAIGTCLVLGCTPTAVFGSLAEKNSTTDTVALPKIGLAFDLTEDHTIAATVSRGYRAGFSEAVPGVTAVNRVDPEYLWSYEIALRTRWLDDRLEINANGFYYDYENQQIPTLNPAFPGQVVTANSGESHAYGLELDARFQATEELTIFGAVGLLKTEFDRGVTSAGQNLAGSEFPEAPSITASIGGVWRDASGFFASADASYTDDYFSFGSAPNVAQQKIDGFAVVNAQVGYDFGGASVAVYARNLFDNDYLTFRSAAGTQASISDGLMAGVTVRARF